MPASIGLLKRATSLLAPGNPRRHELLCELGLAHYASRDVERAVQLLTEATAAATEAVDRRIELRARIELEYVELRGERKTSADDLLDATVEGIPVFENVGDHRSLGRAWLLTGWVRGGHFCDHAGWADGAERALDCYKAADWPTSTCLGELAAALHWGPTAVDVAVARCEELLRDEARDRLGSAYISVFLGGLVAQQHDFHRARQLVGSARSTFDDLGQTGASLTYCAPVLSEIERLAGELQKAEGILRDLAGELDSAREFSRLASTAGELADVLVAQGRITESDEWTRVAERHTTADDRHAQIRWLPVRALTHAHRGELALAEELGRQAVLVADATDDLNRRANMHLRMCEVFRLAGRARDARSEMESALELYQLKGNLPGAERARTLRGDLALV